MMSTSEEDGNTPAEIIKLIEDAAANGKKIEAIKLFRQATGFGLKDSKDFIDSQQKITEEMITNTNLDSAPSGCVSKAAVLFIAGVSALYHLLPSVF
jgi:ribosomal protein L7/L12